MPNLDIPENVKIYIFYTVLHIEYHNMVDTITRGSIMDIPLDNASNLFEKIIENQSMW